MGYVEPARAAIVYDFDGTLAPGNMQEHSFIPSLDLTPEAFWGKVKATARTEDADEILVYMREMMLLARARGAPITREMLEQHGRVPLFDGLDRWFDRIASYAHEHNLTVEHYVISCYACEPDLVVQLEDANGVVAHVLVEVTLTVMPVFVTRK